MAERTGSDLGGTVGGATSPERPERRRLIAQAAGTLVLALSPFEIVRGATLVGVRVWPATDYTRITLEHDAPLAFSHFMLREAAPLRLVVDIDGIDLTPALRELVGKVTADDPYVGVVRIGQFKPKVVRMVIELKADVVPQVFSLDPVGPYQRRLVLDLHPAAPRDPMLALIDGKSGDRPAGGGASTVQPASAAPPAPDTASPGAPGGPTTPRADGDLIAKVGRGEAVDAPDASAGRARPEPPRRAPAIKRSESIQRVVTVALDPGHGGEDPGAIGRRGTQEKAVTLQIARRLADLVDNDRRMRVLLTRDGDYFVPLMNRVQKARAVQADLFVSIHADAWIRPDARGSSVFALSERGATSTAAAWMARRENDADLIGGINLGTHDAGIARVLLDLSTTAQINDSLRFGGAVLRELQGVNTLHKPRVEQAGFAVLKAPDIPSILVETAFISNPDEEQRLKDAGYQKRMAQAIFSGIRTYFDKYPSGPRSPVG